MCINISNIFNKLIIFFILLSLVGCVMIIKGSNINRTKITETSVDNEKKVIFKAIEINPLITDSIEDK